MGVEDGVVLNQDIFATVGRSLWLVLAALHAETVVTSIDGAVDNESDVDVREVDGITVLGVPRATHRDTIYDDVLGVARVQVKFRCVLDGDTLDEDVLAILKAHQVVAHLLLSLWCVGNVLIAAQVVPRVPQLTTVFLYTTNYLLIFVPLDVAHLLTLHRPPVIAIAVNDALARDSDVLAL